MTQDSHQVTEARSRHGVIAWMARHSVAANLLMAFLIIGGLLMSFTVKQEVFPEFDPDFVTARVIYPGASPEEVEQGIVLAIEEAVRGIEGVKKITSVARESSATVQVMLLNGADLDAAQTDVKAAVDQIRSFPEEAERPIISAAPNIRNVIAVIVAGDYPHETLRQTAERFREGLLAETPVTQTELSGVPSREIAIEIDQGTLRAHRLSLEMVARSIREASIDLPSGAVRARSGEVLVRTTERRNLGPEFGDIVLISRPDGTQVRVADIATIRDGFSEADLESFYNGKNAVRLNVFRVGDQTPVQIAGVVKDFIKTFSVSPGIELATWNDRSEIYADRISLLLRNAAMGLFLVMIVLGLFLEIRLAFWVMLGIPISFLGAFLLFPHLGASINMISMFAFLLVLGIVVDDAIVVGENIFQARREGLPPMEAAILGAKQVATPISFAVATTIATFGPLLFVPGFSGKLFGVIPLIVVSVLVLSLLESLFILPAHLAHVPEKAWGPIEKINRVQRRVSDGLDRFIEGVYIPLGRWLVGNRYAVLSGAVAILLISVGVVAGGFVKFAFFPEIESDLSRASVRLPIGAHVDDTRAISRQLIEGAKRAVARHGDEKVTRGIFAQIGQTLGGFGPSNASSSGSHIVEVQVLLVPLNQRSITARQFVEEWREEVGTLVGVETQSFVFAAGPGSGRPIDVQLSHPNTGLLEEASGDLARALAGYEGVRDIDAGFSNGKFQLDATLTPEGRAVGLTERVLARQLRSAFFGSEALRQQRGRDEVKVMVRLPLEDRRQRASLESLILRTPSGGEIPLSVAADLKEGRAETSIRRVDGRRVLNVTAGIDDSKANANEVLAQVQKDVLPAIMGSIPGLTYSLEGQQADQRESLSTLLSNFVFAALIIYMLLAIPFQSYVQPILIMSVIPFGIVGAIAGHMVMGYNLSVISVLGMVALAGVVVNDSLVLVVATNEYRRAGATATEAVIKGGARRFRPILLTSLTTFFGLLPMIFETSVQARFLIPMAISLGFGVLAATLIVLILVPALYLIIEDLLRPISWLKVALFGEQDDPPDPANEEGTLNG